MGKGEHILIDGTLMDSVYENEAGKGENKINLPLAACRVKAGGMIPKLKRTKPASPWLDTRIHLRKWCEARIAKRVKTMNRK
jgi:hypothetical protein